MSGDRYSTSTREVPVDKPRNTAYPDAAPAVGDLNSQHRVTEHPAGFRVRERGALEGTVVHAYRCPVHGLVDVRVPRAEVPDVVPCPLVSWSLPGGDKEYATREEVVELGRTLGYSDNELNNLESQRCADDCTWAGSQCGQGWAAGECRS